MCARRPEIPLHLTHFAVSISRVLTQFMIDVRCAFVKKTGGSRTLLTCWSDLVSITVWSEIVPSWSMLLTDTSDHGTFDNSYRILVGNQIIS